VNINSRVRLSWSLRTIKNLPVIVCLMKDLGRKPHLLRHVISRRSLDRLRSKDKTPPSQSCLTGIMNLNSWPVKQDHVLIRPGNWYSITYSSAKEILISYSNLTSLVKESMTGQAWPLTQPYWAHKIALGHSQHLHAALYLSTLHYTPSTP